MSRYIVKRILLLIPVMLGVTFVVFFIMSLTKGDPAVTILGDMASEESLAQMRESLGLNDPFFTRYFRYIGDILHGDWGKSYKNQLDVMHLIMERFPSTALLAIAATLFATIVGVPVGILSAKKQYSTLDNVATVAALIGVSMPVFWLGLILVIVFALNLNLLPSQGMGDGFWGVFKSLILPSITLGAYTLAVILRTTRSSMLEVIKKDYIDTARAKGIKESQVTWKHMLSNALIPIITVAGLQFGQLLGGAMITETVFAWPGLGRLMLDSIKARDIPVVLGSVMFICLVFSIVNLVVDILYAFVDPRIKSQYQQK